MPKIAPKGNRYYITKQFKDEGNTFTDGTIHQLTQAQAEYFAGSVEHVAFPALEKIELDIDQVISSYKQQRDEIRTSARYAENETERAWQLKDLREKLDADVQDLRTKYDETVQLTRADLAKKSAQIEIKPEARERASEIIDMAAVQLSFAANQADVLRLMQAQIQQQDEDVQTAVGLQFAKLLPALKEDAAREAAGAVFSQLESPGMREYKTKTRHLDALTADHDPMSSYRQMNLLEGREGR